MLPIENPRRTRHENSKRKLVNSDAVNRAKEELAQEERQA